MTISTSPVSCPRVSLGSVGLVLTIGIAVGFVASETRLIKGALFAPNVEEIILPGEDWHGNVRRSTH